MDRANMAMAATATTARWIPVAEDMVEPFDLKPGDRVLDVGCGKGFLVKDLLKVCPGLEAFGLDISEYVLMHCEPSRQQAVISLNTVHNWSAANASRRYAKSSGSRRDGHSFKSIPIAPRSKRRCSRNGG
jgi:ubiquinone/menaquinone biosynthesis C-methylase UbiE